MSATRKPSQPVRNGASLKLSISIAVGTITLCTLFISGNLWVLDQAQKMLDRHDAKPGHAGAVLEKDILRLFEELKLQNSIRFNKLDEELREIRMRINK